MGRTDCICLFSTHESFARDDIVWASRGLVSSFMNICVSDLLSVVVAIGYSAFVSFLTTKIKDRIFKRRMEYLKLG